MLEPTKTEYAPSDHRLSVQILCTVLSKIKKKQTYNLGRICTGKRERETRFLKGAETSAKQSVFCCKAVRRASVSGKIERTSSSSSSELWWYLAMTSSRASSDWPRFMSPNLLLLPDVPPSIFILPPTLFFSIPHPLS